MHAVQYSAAYSQCHCAMGGEGWELICDILCVYVCMTYCQLAQQSCLHQTTLGHLALTVVFAIL